MASWKILNLEWGDFLIWINHSVLFFIVLCVLTKLYVENINLKRAQTGKEHPDQK